MQEMSDVGRCIACEPSYLVWMRAEAETSINFPLVLQWGSKAP